MGISHYKRRWPYGLAMPLLQERALGVLVAAGRAGQGRRGPEE